ncbi:hypothetical protein SpCBS45565_g05018 [Spizellomyces sp. 'palustris']|nr:hypothetical protein SpCBS45565_g05018 [Spizellomyces sp. 'palustris']
MTFCYLSIFRKFRQSVAGLRDMKTHISSTGARSTLKSEITDSEASASTSDGAGSNSKSTLNRSAGPEERALIRKFAILVATFAVTWGVWVFLILIPETVTNRMAHQVPDMLAAVGFPVNAEDMQRSPTKRPSPVPRSSRSSAKLPTGTILTLPPEVALNILTYLEGYSLIQASQTCSLWYQLCQDESIWYKFAMKRNYIDSTHVMAKSPESHPLRREMHLTSETSQGWEWKRWVRQRLELDTRWDTGQWSKNSFTGHTDVVLAVAIDENQGRIISGDRTGKLQIMDLNSTVTRQQGAHRMAVSCLQISDGNVISGSWDGIVKIWEYYLGGLLMTTRPNLILRHPSSVICIRTSASLLAVGTMTSGIQLWNRQTLQPVRNVSIPDSTRNSVHSVDFNSSYIYAAVEDDIYVWSRNSYTLVARLELHKSTITSLRLLDNGRIVTGDEKGIILVWTPKEEISALAKRTHGAIKRKDCSIVELKGHTDGVRCLQASCGRLITGAYDNTVRIWSLTTLKLLHTLKSHIGDVNAVDCTAEMIVSGSDDGLVKVWDFRPGVPERDPRSATNQSWADAALIALKHLGGLRTCDEIFHEIERRGLYPMG